MFNPNKPVQTRGLKNIDTVEILATDIHGTYPIVAKLTYANGVKIIRHYTIEGLEQYGCEGLDDLINIPETHKSKEVKKYIVRSDGFDHTITAEEVRFGGNGLRFYDESGDIVALFLTYDSWKRSI